MLDIKFLRDNLALIQETAHRKNCAVDLEKLLALDTRRRTLLKSSEEIKARKNQAGEKIVTLEKEAKAAAIAALRAVGEEEKILDSELKSVEAELFSLMLLVPQPTGPDTPIGKDDSENQELFRWGEPPSFDFPIKDHIALGQELDIIDLPRAAKVAGSRNYFLKGWGALLEHAVLQYTISKLVAKGFTLFNPPQIVNYEAMMGTSYFPGGEEQAYAVGVEKKRGQGLESDKKYLIGTSEVPVTSYHADEILREEDLPKLYAGFSSCYRREAGSYGKDTQGLYRVHQFFKVEQVVICKNDLEESHKMHEFIRLNAEEILRDLNLPYRVVAVCTGDIGLGQYYKNDIETWMPSRQGYGETHSCSTFLEFQARRLNLRYKDRSGKIHFAHTLNNTAIATPRLLIPLLEIYQNPDGSVTVPAVLRPYLGGLEKITPPSF